MGEPPNLLNLARRRLDLLATARATMEGKYDRKPQPQAGVSRSHPIGHETVRLAPPLPKPIGLTVSAQSQRGETDETALPLATIHARVASWSEDMRDAWEERAAIVEHLGGETRDDAERLAWLELKPDGAARCSDD